MKPACTFILILLTATVGLPQNPLDSATALLPVESSVSDYRIAGKLYRNIESVTYRNRKIIFQSESGISSIAVEKLEYLDFKELPESILEEVRADIPLLVERLEQIQSESYFHYLEVEVPELTIGSDMILNVDRIVVDKRDLTLSHEAGQFNIRLAKLTKSDFSQLPESVQEILAKRFFYFRASPLPETLKSAHNYQGPLDQFIARFSESEQIVLSIDPLIRRGVIPRNAQVYLNWQEGEPVFESLIEQFQKIDRRLTVYHITEGLYFVSFEDCEIIHRALLTFLDRDYLRTLEWLEFAESSGTFMDRYIEQASQRLKETQIQMASYQDIERTIFSMMNESRSPRSTDLGTSTLDASTMEVIEQGRALVSNLLEEFLGGSSIISVSGNDWVPAQFRLTTCQSIMEIVSKSIRIENHLATLRENRVPGIPPSPNHFLDRVTENMETLQLLHDSLDEITKRSQLVNLEDHLPKNAIGTISRDHYDRLKLMTDNSYANSWDWDTRVLSGSLDTFGKILTDTEFEQLSSGPTGFLTNQALLAPHIEARIKSLFLPGTESVPSPASVPWNSSVGFATGLVVSSPRYGDIYGDTFVFAVDKKADPKSAMPISSIMVDTDVDYDKKLSEVFHYQSLESRLDFYAIYSMRRAMLWALSHEKLEKLLKTVKESGNTLVLKLEQGLGINLGGDSAGVAWALAIQSATTDIPLHSEIAVTGSIGPEGLIAEVGGIYFKVNGAREKRCLALFLPTENEADVDSISMETHLNLQIIGASSLDDLQPFVFDTNESKSLKTYLPGATPRSDEMITSFKNLTSAYLTALYRIDQQEFNKASWVLQQILEVVPNHYSARRLLDAIEPKISSSEGISVDSEFLAAIGFQEKVISTEKEKNTLQSLLAENMIFVYMGGAVLICLLFAIFVMWLYSKKYRY
ncbi:MAG: S16 family serine protease [Verrucomicrobiota bacterium]